MNLGREYRLRRLRVNRSIVTRLVTSLILGGVVVSFALGMIELKRSEALLQMEMAQRVVQNTRMIQSKFRGTFGRRSPEALRGLLEAYLIAPRLYAARVTYPDGGVIILKDWHESSDQKAVLWHLSEFAIARGDEVDLERITQVLAPFTYGDDNYLLELLIDGPTIQKANQARVLRDLASQWILLAVMILLGLLLLRRWITGPLSQVVELVSVHAGPGSFYRLARRSHSEFAQLAEAIGGMLNRLESTTEQLRRREQAFESLYQAAPAAMISLDKAGKIIEANRRAAQLLAVPDEGELVGRRALDFIRAEDRGLLRQAIERLDLASASRCQLRITILGKTVHVAVECVGVRDEDGVMQNVRLSLLDVSEAVHLQSAVTNKSRLLDLVINHMSDAILLVDAEGRIAAVNQQLGALLKCRPDHLTGQSYNPDHFWEELGVIEAELFVTRLKQIDADKSRPAQERFKSRMGTFLFQGIPVHDAMGEPMGRLWVVSEITSQDQSQRLLNQQTSQLQGVKRLGQELAQIRDADQFLERAATLLYELFEVETVGLALRCDESSQRSRQIIHRGGGAYLLEPNRALVGAVERYLMPQLLSNRDVTLWPDLPHDTPWARTFNQAGLTCLAGTPLVGCGDMHGILWIARRGGERLERHHIYLLEALVPMLAVRLDVFMLHERLENLHLIDPATDLPNDRFFDCQLEKVGLQPARPWSILVIQLDHFQTLESALTRDSTDQLLRSVGLSLQRSTRRNCFVARLEGPTFGVVGSPMDHEATLALALRLLSVISAQQITLPDGRIWRVTASIGAASSPIDGTAWEELRRLAHARLETARRSGRDRVVAADPAPIRQVG